MLRTDGLLHTNDEYSRQQSIPKSTKYFSRCNSTISLSEYMEKLKEDEDMIKVNRHLDQFFQFHLLIQWISVMSSDHYRLSYGMKMNDAHKSYLVMTNPTNEINKANLWRLLYWISDKTSSFQVLNATLRSCQISFTVVLWKVKTFLNLPFSHQLSPLSLRRSSKYRTCATL